MQFRARAKGSSSPALCALHGDEMERSVGSCGRAPLVRSSAPRQPARVGDRAPSLGWMPRRPHARVEAVVQTTCLRLREKGEGRTKQAEAGVLALKFERLDADNKVPDLGGEGERPVGERRRRREADELERDRVAVLWVEVLEGVTECEDARPEKSEGGKERMLSDERSRNGGRGGRRRGSAREGRTDKYESDVRSVQKAYAIKAKARRGPSEGRDGAVCCCCWLGEE